MGEAVHGSRHDAFDRYVVPQIEVLYRIAPSLTGQPADAEDLVQDTLIRAFRAVDRTRTWFASLLS